MSARTCIIHQDLLYFPKDLVFSRCYTLWFLIHLKRSGLIAAIPSAGALGTRSGSTALSAMEMRSK